MRLKAVYCLLIFLIGCAQVPRPSTYPYSLQQQMQAAHHWQVHASEVAERVAKELKDRSVASGDGVYVQNDHSPFGQAFPNLLITELWNNWGIPAFLDPPNNPFCNRDIPVSVDRRRPCLEWAVQRVVHQANRTRPHASLAEAIIAIPPSIFVDLWPGMAAGSLPHSEIIITTQFKDENRRTLLHNSDLYYINDQDWRHYPLGPSLPLKSYPVVNSSFTTFPTSR
jgi:hypothetical protein